MDRADVFFSLAIGFFTGLLVTITCTVYFNNSVVKHTEGLEKVYKACQRYNELPVEFDFTGEVVCTGGVELKISSFYK